MNLPNRNPETDIRYGYISAQSLHPDVIDELQQRGVDLHYEEAKSDFLSQLRHLLEDNAICTWSINGIIEAASDAWGDAFYDDEPVHEGEYESVHYRTSWMGGALHVWVFESPIAKKYQECSPCVLLGAGNLDCPDPDGVLTYDVPAEWRVNDD